MLGHNSYGKSGIRLVKVIRGKDRHAIVDLTVSVSLEGEFGAAHEAGDNADVLPTDTMKNTVYAIAAKHPLDTIESFARDLGAHFVKASPAVTRARVTVEEHPWDPLPVGGAPHPHAFARSGAEVRTACAARSASEETVESGLEGLLVMKSAQSAFSGFYRDRFTTLADARDRIFATAVSARWRYIETGIDFRSAASAVRQTLLEAFADHASESVQHTLYAMGEAVLAGHREVQEVRLSLPNKHHWPVDLSAFGLENRNEIFVATEEPYGLIEATLRREQGAGSKEQE